MMRRVTKTLIVLSPLSLTTVPCNTRRGIVYSLPVFLVMPAKAGIPFCSTKEKTNGIPDKFSFVRFAPEKKIFGNDG
jgi:hypothetical protein